MFIKTPYEVHDAHTHLASQCNSKDDNGASGQDVSEPRAPFDIPEGVKEKTVPEALLEPNFISLPIYGKTDSISAQPAYAQQIVQEDSLLDIYAFAARGQSGVTGES